MNKGLLIVGAGVYGLVAKEIAESMACFDKITFVDDNAKTMPNGIEVMGTISDAENLVCEYYNVIVAIGNPEVRLRLIKKFEEEMPCRIISLISPSAYISPSAQFGKGCIVEPMATIHTGCVLTTGCIVSAGAVVNHCSMLCDGVHIDCNATVAGCTIVPAGTKVCSGEVFKKDTVNASDLFFDSEKWAEKLQEIKARPHGPIPFNGREYCFEDGM